MAPPRLAMKEEKEKWWEKKKLASVWLSLVVKLEGNHPLVDPTLPSHQPDSRHWNTVIMSPFLKLNPAWSDAAKSCSATTVPSGVVGASGVADILKKRKRKEKKKE